MFNCNQVSDYKLLFNLHNFLNAQPFYLLTIVSGFQYMKIIGVYFLL